MKVFDFDNTIYDGESALDFFLFCLKRKKSLIKHLPSVIFNLIRYKTGRVGLDVVYPFCSKMMCVFFENSAAADELLYEFWAQNRHKLRKHMLEKLSPEDAIISASPRFLLNGIAPLLKVNTLICTETERDRVTFLCYGPNKVKAFREVLGDKEIEEFYTDSLNDEPMMRLAKRAYLVKGNKTEEYL